MVQPAMGAPLSAEGHGAGGLDGRALGGGDGGRVAGRDPGRRGSVVPEVSADHRRGGAHGDDLGDDG